MHSSKLFRALIGLLALVGAFAPAAAIRPRIGSLGFRPGFQFVSLGAGATSLQPIERGNAGLATATVTSSQAAQYTVHTVRGSATGDLIVTLAAVTWDTLLGELPIGNDISFRVQVETPKGSGTFSTAVTGTVPNGQSLDVDTGVPVPADGSDFGLFVWASAAVLPTRGTGGAINTELYTDEGCIVSTTVSTTPTNAIADSFSRRRRLALVAGIFAQRATTDKTVAVVGDSIQAYETATLAANSATSDHVRGDLTRTISQSYATINLGIGGDQPSTALFASRPIWRMLWGRATYVANAYGINEFNNRNLSAAAALAYRANFVRLFNGKHYIDGTLTPRVTATTDAYATEANQTAATYSAATDTYNTAIRAQANFIERRTPIQGINPDVWPVNGTANYSTLDGLHPSLTGLGLIMETQTAIKAALDAAPVAAFVQADPTLTLAATPAFAGGKFTRGTAIGNGFVASAAPASSEAFFTVTSTAANGFGIFDWQLGSAGAVAVNSSGNLVFKAGNGSNLAGTTVLTGTGERHVEVDTSSTGTKVYLDGVLEITLAWTPNATQTNTNLAVHIPNGGGAIRQIASFAALRHSANFTPPAPGYLVPASDPTCVAYWPLATDGSGQVGGYLP
jgi:hypothetical protein